MQNAGQLRSRLALALAPRACIEIPAAEADPAQLGLERPIARMSMRATATPPVDGCQNWADRLSLVARRDGSGKRSQPCW